MISKGIAALSVAAFPAVIARSRADISFKLPKNLPIAVRHALTITTSFISTLHPPSFLKCFFTKGHCRSHTFHSHIDMSPQDVHALPRPQDPLTPWGKQLFVLYVMNHYGIISIHHDKRLPH
jgi:hypothetical protein